MTREERAALRTEALSMIDVLEGVDRRIYQNSLGPAVSQAGKDAHVVRLLLRVLDEQDALLEAAADAITTCGKQFRFYETQHRDKGTPEADDKAVVNGAFAFECEALAWRISEHKS
jgi:hypothetical protein